jgi:hypothetical protein
MSDLTDLLTLGVIVGGGLDLINSVLLSQLFASRPGGV